MIRIIIIAVIFCLQLPVAYGQQSNDQRTLSTKIADLLAAMPAANESELNKNMQLISGINEKGLQELLSIYAAGQGKDNSAAEYAIAGYSFFVTAPGNEQKRQVAVKAFCNALSRNIPKLSKEFIIRQLQVTGKDDAISCLQKYLRDEELADPAARALAQINSAASKKALFAALTTAKGKAQLAITEALGYTRYTPALASLTNLAKSGNKELRKVALYSVSQMADASSAPVLSAAVKQANYSFDASNAVANYLHYVKQLAAKGNTQLADKLAKELLQQSRAATQLQTRTAALKLLVDINKEKSLPLLYEAMSDPDAEYRAAALGFGTAFQHASVNSKWLQTASSISPEAKAQVIDMLGYTNDKSLLPSIRNAMKDDNEEVRIAAITAAARIGHESVLPSILEVMKKGSPEEIAAAKRAILGMQGSQVTYYITNSMEDMPSPGKIAIIEVLGSRANELSVRQVMTQLKSQDTAVRRAAVLALPTMVTESNLQELFPLLQQANAPEEINAFQRSIIAATGSIRDSAARSRLLLDQLRATPNDKQYLLFEVLAASAADAAIPELQAAFQKGNDQVKKAAINAMAHAGTMSAARSLLNMASDASNTAYREAALNAYVQIISRSSFSGDQKLLMLREAMSLAQQDNQRRTIIREAGRCNTFLALVFAGNYLDVPALQQEAANAVMNIALANKQFTGDLVRRLLTKTADLMKGGDSDYLKVAIQKHLAEMPPGEGFVALFNEKDLTGWKGLVADPLKRAKMDAATLAAEQEKANKEMKEGWVVKDGLLVFTGHGNNLSTEKKYGDFEMLVDWKITKEGDAGIYLRGTPQVQIWDTSRRQVGAQVGSGGLYNNQKNPSKPLVVADNAIGEWNTFRIIMKGEKVTVYLNGQLVTDNVTLENYWDRSQPIFPKDYIELQAHGTYVAYRNLFIKELNASAPFVLSEAEKKEGFKVLFDGSNLNEFVGNKTDYVIDNGDLLVKPATGSRGNLYTKNEYGDFIFRFEFQLTPGANNGLGIRTPMTGDAAYVGMELQILDNTADIYKNLEPYQYHGSVYGIIPAKREFLKPVGEWNYQEVIVKGSKIKVILNNQVILDGDIEEAVKNGTPDHKEHPGLKNKKGHIGFLGHGSVLRFRNIRIKDLSERI